jgi:predicted CXXCH cytochrome family protein
MKKLWFYFMIFIGITLSLFGLKKAYSGQKSQKLFSSGKQIILAQASNANENGELPKIPAEDLLDLEPLKLESQKGTAGKMPPLNSSPGPEPPQDLLTPELSEDLMAPEPLTDTPPPVEVSPAGQIPPMGDTVAAPQQPAGSIFSADKILEAYQNFMKMTAIHKQTGTEVTQQAKDNPIWKFHGWLQQQIEKLNKESPESLEENSEGLEGLCYVCHNAQNVINKNFSGDQKGIQEAFQLESRHPVNDSEKSTLYDPLFPNDSNRSDPIWARDIQCTTCHNPGVVTGKTSEGGYPLTLPTEPGLPYTQKLIDGWPTLDNPPWPHDTPPRPLLYARPYADDPNPDIEGDEVLGPDETQLPDFTTFCQTCHRQIAGRYGSTNDYSRLKYDPIRFIKGDGGGVISTHGLARGRETESDSLKLKEPFKSIRYDEEGNVIANLYLSCTDCHEPHGSENPFLIRTKVNGKKGIKTTQKAFFELCDACHYIANPWPGGYPHGNPGDMSKRNCIECHNHASGGGRF